MCSLRHSLWKAKHCSKRKETRCVGGAGAGTRTDYGMRCHADEDDEDDEGEMFTEDCSETDSDERVSGRKPQPRKSAKKPGTGRPAGAAGVRARQQQQGGGDSPQSYPNSPQHHPLLQAANPLRLDEVEGEPSTTATQPFANCAFAIEHDMRVVGMNMDGPGAGMQADGSEEDMRPLGQPHHLNNCWQQPGTLGRASSSSRSRVDNSEPTAHHTQWDPKVSKLLPQTGYVQPLGDFNNVVVHEDSSDLGRMYPQVPDGSGANAARGDVVQARMWKQDPGAMHTTQPTCDTRPDRFVGQRIDEEGADSTYMYSPQISLQMHRQHSSQHLYQQTTGDEQLLLQQQSRALSASLGPSLNGLPQGHGAGSEGGFPDSMLHIPSAMIKFEGPEDNTNLTEERLGRMEAGLGPGALGNTFVPASWSGGGDLGGRRLSNPKQQGRALVGASGAPASQQQWSMNAGIEMNGSSNQQLLNLGGFQQQFSVQQQHGQHCQYSLNGNAMVGAATAETISRLQQQSQLQQRFYSLGAGNIQGNQQPTYPYGNNSGQDNHLHWTAPDNNGSGHADSPSWPNQSPAHSQLQLQGQQAGQMAVPGMSHHNPHQQQTIMQPPRCAILANGQEDHPSNPMSPFSPKSQRMMNSSSMPAAFPGYHHAQGGQADALSRAVTSPWLPAATSQYDSLNRVSHNSNTSLAGTPRVTYGSSDGYLDLPTIARVNSWDALPGVDTLTGLAPQVNPSPTLLERGMSGMLAMEDDPLGNMDRSGPRRTTERDNSVIGGSGEFQHLFDGYDIGTDLIVTATAALGNPPNLPPLRTHCAPSPFASQRLYPFAHLNLPEGAPAYPSQYPVQTEEPFYAQATHGPSSATTPRQSGLVLDLSVPSQGPDELARASSWHRSSSHNPDSCSPGSGGSGAPLQYANSHRMSLSRGLDNYSPQAYFITERMSMLTHASGDMGAETPKSLEELAELQHVRNEAYARSLNIQIHRPVDASAMPIAAGPTGFDQTAAEFDAAQGNSGHLQPLDVILTVPSGVDVAGAGRAYSDLFYGTGMSNLHRTDSDGFDMSKDTTPRAGAASVIENPFDTTSTLSTARQLLAHNPRAAAGRDVKGFVASASHTTRSLQHTAPDRKQVQTALVPSLPAQHASAGLGYAIPAAATPLLANSSRFKLLALATSSSLPLGQAAASMLTASPQRHGFGQNEPSHTFDGVATERSRSLEDPSMARATLNAAQQDVAPGEQQHQRSEGHEDVVVRGRRAHGRLGNLGVAAPINPSAGSALAAAAVDQTTSHVGGDAGCWVVGSASAGAVASASTLDQPQQHRSASGCGNLGGSGSLSGLAPLYKLKLQGEGSSQGLDAEGAEQLLQAASECTELELTQPTGVFRNLAAIRVHSSGLIEQVQGGGQTAARQAFPWTDVGLDSPRQGQTPGSPSLRACKDSDVGFGSRNGSPKRAHAVEQGSLIVNSPTKKGRTAVQGSGMARGASLMMEAGSKAPQVVSRMRPGTADGPRDAAME